MFVGHYGISFAAKSLDRSVPLWVLFVAVQLLDVFWAPFVLLGIERVRIVPGITATNPLDLYYMPYTHSLAAAVAWSVIGYGAYRLARGGAGARRAASLVAIGIFSHWVLDLIVHRPDLALYDDTWKVGFGLWNHPLLALICEGALLLGGVSLYLRRAGGGRLKAWTVAFATLLFAVHVYTFFGPPLTSPAAAATTALVAYVLFAGGAALLEVMHGPPFRAG